MLKYNKIKYKVLIQKESKKIIQQTKYHKMKHQFNNKHNLYNKNKNKNYKNNMNKNYNSSYNKINKNKNKQLI